MAINPNKPVQPSGFDRNSISEMNNVSKKALEAVGDLVYDADGDDTGFDDVKEAYQQLTGAEKAAFTAGAVLTGGALPAVSLIGEGVVEAAKGAQKLGQKAAEAVQEKYSHPPEEKAAKEIEKKLHKVGDKLEEFGDDLKDGRTFRDVGKGGKRFFRDNFTERTPAEKFKDDVSDFFEDAGDAVSDFIDDVKDGRIQKKIKHAIEDH